MDQQASSSDASREGCSETAEEKIVRFLKQVCRNGPIDYFPVVLDPTSFARTLVNMYSVSILANEGKLFVYGAGGKPYINTVPDSKQSAENSEEPQLIITVDMDRWQRLVEELDITEPMLKLN